MHPPPPPLSFPVPIRTIITEQNTVRRKSMSMLPILSCRMKYAIIQTHIGAKLQTIPTVETLKYFKLENDMT